MRAIRPLLRAAGVTAVTTLALASPASSQDAPPEGWVVQPDSGVAGDVFFVSMAPGWHLTTGPATLVYDPARVADGAFRVEAEAFRFPGEPAGYGVFLGGRGLEPATYDFFEILLDAAGRFRVAHRAGPELHVVVPWTAHDAVVPVPAEGNARNLLAVEVRPPTVTVLVNGTGVTSFEPPEYARFDGVVGLRALGDVNVHVVRLDVTPLDEEPSGR